MMSWAIFVYITQELETQIIIPNKALQKTWVYSAVSCLDTLFPTLLDHNLGSTEQIFTNKDQSKGLLFPGIYIPVTFLYTDLKQSYDAKTRLG